LQKKVDDDSDGFRVSDL